MENELFQNIFDKLEDVLPSEWKKVAFFAHYTAGSYSMRYYLQQEKGPYMDCYKLESISKAQRRQLFKEIDKVISASRKSLDTTHTWSSFALIVDSDGGFNSYFDYADLNEEPLEYARKWEQKCLEK